MRLKVLSWLLLLLFPTAQLAAQAAASAEQFSPPTRAFHFTYNFTVKDIPSGAKRVRVWVPVPQTDQHQTVRVLAVKAPVKTRMTQEPEYGNRMMYAEIENPAAGKAEFTLEYKVTRREYSRRVILYSRVNSALPAADSGSRHTSFDCRTRAPASSAFSPEP